MLGRIYNEDSFEALVDIANECVNPVIVTDPPFNVGYGYRTYKDRLPEQLYYATLGQMLADYPSVVIHYPEALHRLSYEMGMMPEKVVSWVYNANTHRQHRDVAFYRIKPDFDRVRQAPKDAADKRNAKAIAERGGVRSYDWYFHPQVKNLSKEKTAHPCQMPLDVMRRIIGWLPDDITVIDPFAGSGTTAVACEMAGIPWRAIEIDPAYCEIINGRIGELK